MRRMYTEQQLTAIIKEVFDAEVSSGVFDDKIKEYAEDWLEENPLSPGDLDFTGIDLVAKTLKQLNPNESYTFTPVSTLFAGKVTRKDGYFGRAVVVNNVLMVVGFATYENEGESSVTISGADYLGNIVLSEETAEKIYRVDGTDLSGEEDTDTIVCFFPGTIAKGDSISSAEAVPFSLYSSSAKNLTTNFRLNSPMTLDVGESFTIHFRVFLTLI